MVPHIYDDIFPLLFPLQHEQQGQLIHRTFETESGRLQSAAPLQLFICRQ